MKIPHSIEAERAVLGAVLLDARAYDRDRVQQLQPDDFYKPGHTAIWGAMRGLLNSGETVDIVKLEQALRVNDELSIAGGLEGLASIADGVASSFNADDHARIVLGHARTRALQQACLSIAEGCGTVDYRDATAYAAEAAAEVADLERGGADGMHSWRSCVQAAIDDAKSREDGTTTPVSWGLPSVDSFFDGGMGEGHLVVIGARPGMGKTALVQGTAIASSERGEVPLVFSLEMMAQQLGRRAIATRGQINNRQAKTPSTERGWSHMASAFEHFRDLPGSLWTRAITLPALVAKARAWRRRCRQSGQTPGPIVVDYLQLIKMGQDARRENRERQVAICSATLKELAKDLGVPLILLCQLNRGIESRPLEERRPRESDFRESGAIEQDADVLAGLFRRHRYEKSAPPEDAELVVIKNREGVTGTVKLRFEGHFSRFLDAPEFIAQQRREEGRNAPGFTYQGGSK